MENNHFYDAVSDRACNCCSKHVPAPLSVMGLDTPAGIVYICPTAMFNLKHLLNRYDEAGGKPVGSITKHYGKVIRDLAETIYLADLKGK